MINKNNNSELNQFRLTQFYLYFHRKTSKISSSSCVPFNRCKFQELQRSNIGPRPPIIKITSPGEIIAPSAKGKCCIFYLQIGFLESVLHCFLASLLLFQLIDFEVTMLYDGFSPDNAIRQSTHER